jgi:hypothetical protein
MTRTYYGSRKIVWGDTYRGIRKFVFEADLEFSEVRLTEVARVPLKPLAFV